MVTRVFGSRRMLVVAGRVVKSMSSSKVEVGATSHASQVTSNRLKNELPPDPVAMLLVLPETEPFKVLAPLLAYHFELLGKDMASVYYPLLDISVGQVYVVRLLVDLFIVTAGVALTFGGGLKTCPNKCGFFTLTVLHITTIRVGAAPTSSFLKLKKPHLLGHVFGPPALKITLFL